MSPETVLDIGRQALKVTMYMGAPLLLSALVVGLLISLFQAATQINEMSLSFIPKLTALAITLMLGGPWMMGLFIDYVRQLYASIPGLIG